MVVPKPTSISIEVGTSRPDRMRIASIAWIVSDYLSFLKESMLLVLDEGCTFIEVKLALLMSLQNIVSMSSVDAPAPYRW